MFTFVLAMGMAVTALGIAYAVGGDRIVQALTPDRDGCAGSSDVPTPGNTRDTERATLCLINARRAEAGLPALEPSSVLTRAAKRHSDDMGKSRYFAHDNPDGADPVRRIVAAGYPRTGVVVGEKDSQDFPTKFIAAIAQHRFWARHDKDLVSG